MTDSKSRIMDPETYWQGSNKFLVFASICENVFTSAEGGEHEQ